MTLMIMMLVMMIAVLSRGPSMALYNFQIVFVSLCSSLYFSGLPSQTFNSVITVTKMSDDD